MLLHPDPSLAEVPGFSAEQLESLTRSVEQRRQKLEADINDYIRQKQEQLRKYEKELLEQYRSMDSALSNRGAGDSIASSMASPSESSAVSQSSAEDAGDSIKHAPAETAKRTKHNRVHKREKELCGLVTPIFLPLLDARESSPTLKKKKEKRRQREEKAEAPGEAIPSTEQGSPSRDAEKGKETRRSRSRNREEKVDRGDPTMIAETKNHEKKDDSGKKSKRSAIKKSSMRHSHTKSRRKRVSLVIDDQIVLPADNVDAVTVTSPSETSVSTASNSTASLEDMVDPRLLSRHDTPAHSHEHHDAVHHSLPLPMGLPSASPTKHTGHTLSESPPPLDPLSQPPTNDFPSPPQLEYEPPQTLTRTYLDPSPSHPDAIPEYAAPGPIYADEPELAEEPEEEFSTYVGGLSGSGVDNVDQVGSYGYPSSLGASYLENYMKSRPLSVRIAAVEKAGLHEGEKQTLMMDREKERLGEDEEEDFEVRVGKVDDLEEEGMDVIGSMEGF